mmetsp:Transcript_19281/g.28279  ORF Transcript_19281/g.28279 Transcript_19281/m.28279 type:complete len:369 (+) Transcript_19281:125-1231(+)
MLRLRSSCASSASIRYAIGLNNASSKGVIFGLSSSFTSVCSNDSSLVVKIRNQNRFKSSSAPAALRKVECDSLDQSSSLSNRSNHQHWRNSNSNNSNNNNNSFSNPKRSPNWRSNDTRDNWKKNHSNHGHRNANAAGPRHNNNNNFNGNNRPHPNNNEAQRRRPRLTQPDESTYPNTSRKMDGMGDTKPIYPTSSNHNRTDARQGKVEDDSFAKLRAIFLKPNPSSSPPTSPEPNSSPMNRNSSQRQHVETKPSTGESRANRIHDILNMHASSSSQAAKNRTRPAWNARQGSQTNTQLSPRPAWRDHQNLPFRLQSQDEFDRRIRQNLGKTKDDDDDGEDGRSRGGNRFLQTQWPERTTTTTRRRMHR